MGLGRGVELLPLPFLIFFLIDSLQKKNVIIVFRYVPVTHIFIIFNILRYIYLITYNIQLYLYLNFVFIYSNDHFKGDKI